MGQAILKNKCVTVYTFSIVINFDQNESQLKLSLLRSRPICCRVNHILVKVKVNHILGVKQIITLQGDQSKGSDVVL